MTDQVDTGAEPMDSNQRMANRASLAQRFAKIVCFSGEFVCKVRDVSDAGVGLTFYHDAPSEPRVILELANGLTYPIERVWQGKKRSGYRFASPIDTQEFIAEDGPFSAREIRLRIQSDVRIANVKSTILAKLCDLSCNGAKIESDAELPKQCLMRFEFGMAEPQLGQICWRDGNQYGVQFQHPLTIEELSERAVELQPFHQPKPTRMAGALRGARVA